MKVYSILLYNLILLLPVVCLAGGGDIDAYVNAESGIVKAPGHTALLSLNDASIYLKSEGSSVKLDGYFLSDVGDGWDKCSKSEEKPTIKKTNTSVTLSAVFPITDKRKLTVILSAYKDIPAIFVTSRLTRLDTTRGEYYYWQTNSSFDRMITSENPDETKVNVDEWQSYGQMDWMLLRKGKQDGLMVMTTARSGRSNGENGSLFLNAVPSSYIVSPGTFHNCSFGLAFVKNASEARNIYDKSVKSKVPAIGFVPGTEKPKYGKSSPEWLKKAEKYTLYYQPSATWSQELFDTKLKHYPLIVGSTPDKKALDMCHKAGIKLLVYVNYMEIVDTKRLTEGGREIYYEWAESIDKDYRDLKNHPDWFCIDSKGDIMRSAFAINTNNPGLFFTCLHQPGLHEAALRQVRMIMEAGYDGVFIDNAMAVPDCYGDKTGKHKHPTNKTNTQMYEDLQREIYAVVKSYGKDRIVMQNGMLPSHWEYCDSWMAESMPFHTGDFSNDWSELKWMGMEHSGAEKHSKVPVILPYMSDMPDDKLKSSTLFSLVYARLYGFMWTDCMALLDRPQTREFGIDLLENPLGEPVGDIKNIGEVLYKEFQNGIAVLNSGKSPVNAVVPVKSGYEFRSLGYGDTLKASRKRLTVSIPPQTGRALVRIK